MEEALLFLSLCMLVAIIVWAIMVYRAVVCVPLILREIKEIKEIKQNQETLMKREYQAERRSSGVANVHHLDDVLPGVSGAKARVAREEGRAKLPPMR